MMLREVAAAYRWRRTRFRGRELRSAKSNPVHANGTEIALTVSIGACLADPNDNVDSLIKAAVDALYAAKQGERDRVMLAPDSTRSAPDSGNA